MVVFELLNILSSAGSVWDEVSNKQKHRESNNRFTSIGMWTFQWYHLT